MEGLFVALVFVASMAVCAWYIWYSSTGRTEGGSSLSSKSVAARALMLALVLLLAVAISWGYGEFTDNEMSVSASIGVVIIIGALAVGIQRVTGRST